VKQLGLNHKSIHDHYNGCVLFRGESSTTTICPMCQMPCFVEGCNKVPCKVLHHFPLIPCLKKMYRCSKLVELMSLHLANKGNDGLVCSVCNSKAWKHIDNTWHDYNGSSQHQVSLALNGVNPYVNLSINHFTWLILLLNYNLPPL
jgi:hypothetical protein